MKTAITIASGAALSSEIDMRSYHQRLGFYFPTMTQTAVTFWAAADPDDTFRQVYDHDNNAIAATVAPDRFVGVSGTDLEILMSCNYLKIKMGGNEGADRTIYVVLK
jgi:hypothetical protein